MYKKVSMIRKYHNHTLQTNSRRQKKEPQNTNSHKTSGRKLRKSNQLSLPHHDNFKNYQRHYKYFMQTNKQQLTNSKETPTLERQHPWQLGRGWGKMHPGLPYAVYHHKETNQSNEHTIM